MGMQLKRERGSVGSGAAERQSSTAFDCNACDSEPRQQNHVPQHQTRSPGVLEEDLDRRKRGCWERKRAAARKRKL